MSLEESALDETTVSRHSMPFRGSPMSWGIYVAILAAYPIFMAVMSAGAGGESNEAALSPSLGSLLVVVAIELAIFGLWFGAAWGVSGVSLKQLMFEWRHGWLTPFYGFLYSIGLRVGAGIVLVITLLAVAGVTGGNLESLADKARPDVGKVVDTDSLATDPGYLILNCTVVSFVLAGFREELWRVGMLVGVFVLFPRLDRSFGGRLVAVAGVALLFGLGHAVQGAGAVGLTFVLGLGLGGIIVFHRSIWEAVIAHGFFDASSFLMIFAVKRYFPDLVPGL